MKYSIWFENWLESYIKVYVKPRTYDKYLYIGKKYILPVLGDTELNDLSAVELQLFSAELNKRGLAPNTTYGILSVLKSSLKRAVAFGVIDRQFSDVISRPKHYENRVACFDKNEQKAIENHILRKKNPKLFGIIISLYTGLRIGELLALQWDDVDFKKGEITVSKTCRDIWKYGRYEKILGPPKTRSSERIIPIPKQLNGMLKQLKRHIKGRFVVTGSTEQGAQIRSYQRTFSRLLDKLGIEHRGFHALRHTFATRALEVGMDAKTLSEIMGHRSPVITMQYYAHSMNDHKSEMMNKIGKFLS